MDHEVPYLLNISDDPLLTGSLLYFIKPDVKTTVGADASCTITLKGLLQIEQQLSLLELSRLTESKNTPTIVEVKCRGLSFWKFVDMSLDEVVNTSLDTFRSLKMFDCLDHIINSGNIDT